MTNYIVLVWFWQYLYFFLETYNTKLSITSLASRMLVMFAFSQPRRHSVVTVAWQAQRISDTRLSLVLTALVCWLIADWHWIQVRSPPLVEGRRRVNGGVEMASVRLVRHSQLRRVTALLHAEAPPEVCVQTTAFAHHLRITKGTTH